MLVTIKSFPPVLMYPLAYDKNLVWKYVRWQNDISEWMNKVFIRLCEFAWFRNFINSIDLWLNIAVVNLYWSLYNILWSTELGIIWESILFIPFWHHCFDFQLVYHKCELVKVPEGNMYYWVQYVVLAYWY